MIDVSLMCTVFGVFIIFAFLKGVEIGFKLKKDEPVNVSIKGPLQVIKEHKERKKETEKAERETEESEINLHNIDVYDGTGLGQKDFDC